MYVPDMPDRPQRTASSVSKDAIVVLLAIASFALSGWSLTTLLLSHRVPFGVAIFGVGVFDVLALFAALQVHERRNEPHKGFGARLVMMLTLVASSVVNAAHGYQLGGWMSAVIFGAAPLAFEVAFELRHRSMTGLIWFMFFREARDALRRDVWVRIAPVTEPLADPAMVADPATPSTYRLERTDLPAIGQPGTEDTDTTEGTARTEADTAQRADADNETGNAPAQVIGHAVPDTARPLPALEKSNRLHSPGTEVSKQLSNPSPVSIAEAVRAAHAAGITDPGEIADRVPALLGRPVKADSVKREIRRQRPTLPEPAPTGTGPYL